MISKEDVKRMAELSKLKLSEEELEDFTEEISRIIEFVDHELKEVDTEGVVPTYNASLKNQPLREDKVRESLPKEEVLKNAPSEEYGYFKLPSIMD